MADEITTSVPAIAVTAAVGAVVLLLVLLCSVGKRDKKQANDDSTSEETNSTKPKQEKPEKSTKKTKQGNKPKRSQSVQFHHPWLASTLKGNSGYILGIDFSPNGKYLLNTAEDRTVMLWNTKDFNQKEHKFTKANVELDHATKVRFSPDTKAFIGSLANDNTVRIFRIGKKDDGSPGNISAAFDFPKKHEAEIINIGIASNGKFIMTCARDTSIMIWSIKGELYSTIDTHQMNNSYGAVSPCGRFVASSGFTPDVKVWEVCFDKGGNFQEIKRAFELKGHTAGVHCFSFNNDSSRMASVSKDGTWKYWDTNVRYELGQESYLLHTGNISYNGPSLISLSPDGRTVVIGADNSITVFNAITGKEEEYIENVHSGGIADLSFDLSNKYFVSAGDKHIHVFHNVTGYRATITDLEEKEKKSSGQAMKERIRQQIAEAKSSLVGILEPANGHAESK